MKPTFLPFLLALSVVLAACTSSAAAQPPVVIPASTDVPVFATQPLVVPTSASQPSADLTRVDQQGMVTFEVTPLNLENASDTVTLDFGVAMNTHSVDLSMDLAALATLTTDTGTSVQAAKWEAVPGGHHVSGKLIFPATKDGKGVLDGATKLTLTILNVDAPSRTFDWQLK